jgi:hypothetical protein
LADNTTQLDQQQQQQQQHPLQDNSTDSDHSPPPRSNSVSVRDGLLPEEAEVGSEQNASSQALSSSRRIDEQSKR